MSNHSVIEHRANYHYIKIEEDYVLLCHEGKAPAHCKALILSILETWTNTKRSKGESVAIYMTYPQWEISLYYLYARSMIILSLAELEEAKLITRQPYRTANGKETFRYILNIAEVQNALKHLPEKSAQDTLPKLDAFKNKRVPKNTRLEVDGIPVQNYTGDASKSIPILTSITQLQNIASEERDSATDTHPEPATPSGVEAHAPLSNDQQEQTPLIASDGLHEKVVSKSGARKPRTPVDETLKVRIERVYGYFDALAQETSGDAAYRYQRTKKATDAITQWLNGPTSHELLREVYLQMWAEPANPRTGFQWKNNMKIHSVLAEYDSRSLAIKAKRHAAQPKQGNLLSQPKPFKPLEDDDDEPLQYRPFPSQIQKARQQSLAAARRA